MNEIEIIDGELYWAHFKRPYLKKDSDPVIATVVEACCEGTRVWVMGQDELQPIEDYEVLRHLPTPTDLPLFKPSSFIGGQTQCL